MSVTPKLYAKGTPANETTTSLVLSSPGTVSHPPNRLLICAIKTANEAIPSITDRNSNATWTLLEEVDNGGAAGAAGSIRGYLYYKWGGGTGSHLDDGAIIGDSGNQTYGQIFSFDHVNRVDPFSATAESSQAATTSVTAPGVTTDEDNSLACFFTFFSRDAASTANYSAPTNANLTSVTEVHDQTTAEGVGGGVGLITGIMATAGATGDTTATGAVSQDMSHISVALNPAPSEAIVEAVSAEAWGEMESNAVVEALAAEMWFEIENSARIYAAAAEVWYEEGTAPAGGRRKMSFM